LSYAIPKTKHLDVKAGELFRRIVLRAKGAAVGLTYELAGENELEPAHT